ncbi:helix-turn-helix domain-containing protein [Gracilimonas sp. BCB1]|uniref:helix-turn-helix domain-containing protein n=1 Tax=Gracilimonas sp. BCB1 TaxID=3152362 RepID=UPI0032D91AF6
MEQKQQVQKIFGEVLNEMRLAKNLTQAELAEKCEMDETYISDLERGNYMPSLYTVLKLSMGLELSLAEFTAKLDSYIK